MAEGPVTCQRKWAMMTCAELTAHWDQAIDRFLVGGPAVPKDDRRMRSWFESYRGRGPGAVHLDALPEPYLGTLDRRPVVIVLGLNPGEADLNFQYWRIRNDPPAAVDLLQPGRSALCGRRWPRFNGW